MPLAAAPEKGQKSPNNMATRWISGVSGELNSALSSSNPKSFDPLEREVSFSSR